MRVEGGLVERKGSEQAPGSFAEPKEAHNKSSSKKNKRRQKKSLAMPTLVQKLVNTCREVFSDGQAGAIPSATDVDRIRSVLDHMNPADVGLNPNMPYFGSFGNKGRPPVTYLHVYDCDSFSIGIFCLPPTAVIPLHNHPGMTVFGKLLFGSVHIKSYDWADSSQQANASTSQQVLQRPGMRLAKVKTDGTFTAPCSTSILYPAAGGNLHRLTAVTSCALLDVLGPPYSDDKVRPCTYFNDFPCGCRHIHAPVDGILQSTKQIACVGATTTSENHPNPSPDPAVMTTKRRTHETSTGQRWSNKRMPPNNGLFPGWDSRKPSLSEDHGRHH